MEHNRTYIIIPVFNEDPEILKSVISEFEGYPVIVVDDGSDVPVAVSLKKYPVHNAVQIIKHKTNLGQGAAIQSGVHLAYELGAKVFCTVDGDGQHDFKSCKAMIHEFSSGRYDIILGSRFLHQDSPVPMLKKLFLKGGIWVNYFYSGILLNDAHCGLRVFGREFAGKLSFFNPRQAHASEILWLIKTNNFSYSEFPVKIIYSPYSVKKGQSLWNSFKIVYDLLKHKFGADKK